MAVHLRTPGSQGAECASGFIEVWNDFEQSICRFHTHSLTHFLLPVRPARRPLGSAWAKRAFKSNNDGTTTEKGNPLEMAEAGKIE